MRLPTELRAALQERTRVQEAIASVNQRREQLKVQLAEATKRAHQHGVYLPRKTWRELNEELRVVRSELQTLYEQLGECNRAVRRLEHRQLQDADDRLFVAAAKRLLEPEQLVALWAEVERLRAREVAVPSATEPDEEEDV